MARADELYFGAGSFYHVQHEFAMLERRVLGVLRAHPGIVCRVGSLRHEGGVDG